MRCNGKIRDSDEASGIIKGMVWLPESSPGTENLHYQTVQKVKWNKRSPRPSNKDYFPHLSHAKSYKPLAKYEASCSLNRNTSNAVRERSCELLALNSTLHTPMTPSPVPYSMLRLSNFIFCFDYSPLCRKITLLNTNIEHTRDVIGFGVFVEFEASLLIVSLVLDDCTGEFEDVANR